MQHRLNNKHLYPRKPEFKNGTATYTCKVCGCIRSARVMDRKIVYFYSQDGSSFTETRPACTGR
jgi:hypothetical protein